MATTALPSPKRVKLSDISKTLGSSPATPSLSVGLTDCLTLLATTSSARIPSLPRSLLAAGQAKNDLGKVRAIFDEHGFRTTVVASPRPALSIYKDSCHLNDDSVKSTASTAADDASLAGKTFLLSMLGMHPNTPAIEDLYSSSAKNVYCLMLFCDRIRIACSKALESDTVRRLVESAESSCRCIASTPASSSSPQPLPQDASPKSVLATPTHVHQMSRLSATVPTLVAELISAIVTADPRLRTAQLEREYERISLWNSTFANAHLQLFATAHACDVKDVYFKRSHLPKYERITVYLYDPHLDPLKPPRFTFLPSLRKALDDGPEAVVQDMVSEFWESLLRHGYFATETVRRELTPGLSKFLLSGLAEDVSIPLMLNAHFTPKHPLSLYLHGKAGAGKSSLVRHFTPALNAAIERHVDPEILVRFVKQNLNKPHKDLELELMLRPNNNDLSVMSIIQGRRMTMTQSKPGMVVVGLEEVPSNEVDANPNQLWTCQLMSQRFSGRNGDFKEEKKAPRNSAKRGISGDASLLTLFTSNYELEKPCHDALQRLEMFANLKTVEISAVSGHDRVEFAHAYLKQCVQDRFRDVQPRLDVELKIPFGSGDTRPLVRHLRMLAFFVSALAKEETTTLGSSVTAHVVHDVASHITTVSVGSNSIPLKLASFDNLYPVVPRVFDTRAGDAVAELRKLSATLDDYSELSQILDFYFAQTLAPAVIVSDDESLIQNIIRAVSAQKGVHSIIGIEAGEYKMMKSLYDPNDTPNLRDDILKYGRGANVAVELRCTSKDAQLCIREIIEDTPSMTAFSTNKSALYKAGLLFGVFVEGEITPEVRSRASLIV